MKAKDLIKILESCDPEMEVATHANNHTDYSGYTRAYIIELWNKEQLIMIGNADGSSDPIASPWKFIKEL